MSQRHEPSPDNNIDFTNFEQEKQLGKHCYRTQTKWKKQKHKTLFVLLLLPSRRY